MTALGVYQQGKLLEAPPIDLSYHKVRPGDKGNSISSVSFNLNSSTTHEFVFK